MRLRKRVIKTEGDQSWCKMDNHRLIKPKSTVISKNNKQSLRASQCGSGALQKFISNAINMRTVNANYSRKKGKDLKTILQWHINAKDGTSHFSDVRISQINTLKYHISGLSCKYSNMHKRTFTQPTPPLRPRSSRKQNTISSQQRKESKQFEACCILVDDIYRKIGILREMGYAEYKINDWVLSFCDIRKPSLKQIFMKNVSKSLYTLKEEYEYLKESSQAKERLSCQMQKNKQKFDYIETDQLRQFSHYLEQILIQKNNLKAKEVQESIVDKLSVELIPKIHKQFFSFTKKEPIEAANFIHDITPYEEKYGHFQSFSKINKLRYLELNKVEKNLKNVYEELLQGELRKLVKQTTEKSITLAVASPPAI